MQQSSTTSCCAVLCCPKCSVPLQGPPMFHNKQCENCSITPGPAGVNECVNECKSTDTCASE